MSNLDIHDLRRKVRAARECTCQIGSVTFTLRTPTEHQIEVESLRSGVAAAADDQMLACIAVLRRRLIELAVVGWEGAMVSHLLPGHEPDEPLGFDQELLPMLLDAQPQWAYEIDSTLMERLEQRKKPLEETTKN